MSSLPPEGVVPPEGGLAAGLMALKSTIFKASLSTWLRDYLYIPLGGNRGGEGKTYRNLMTTMLLARIKSPGNRV